MKETVTQTMFIDAFRECNREANFSYYGRIALYEYLTQLEEDCGIEIEFYPIDICCEYTEYENLAEVQENYDSITSLEDLQDRTTVIEFTKLELIDGSFVTIEGGLIIADF